MTTLTEGKHAGGFLVWEVLRDYTRETVTIASSASVSTVDRGSVGPVFISPTVARFRHFATVLGLMPSSRLNCASEACDRCIAALTANVVVALP